MAHGDYWPRGRLLGGCSAINAMLYVRGNRRDYDTWAALGNEGWDYDTVLQYFIKSEDNRVFARSPYHGQGGYLRVNHFEYVDPIKPILERGIVEMGQRLVDDINGPINLGFTVLETTSDEGERFSAAKAFLVPAKHRPNLHVIKNAHVTQLLFADGNETRVNGVEFVITGANRTLTVNTTKEVILSAGSLNSPQILMLSGIGPQQHLESLGIPVRQNLSVGDNLQDHFFVPYVVTFHNNISPPYSIRNEVNSYYTYLTNRTGNLASVGALDFNGFVNTLNDGPYPDIQYAAVHLEQGNPDWRAIMRLYGYNEVIIESMGHANDAGDVLMWAVILINPRSAGTVRLRSSNPFDTPRLTPNFCAVQADVDTAVRGIRLIQEFEKTQVFRDNDGEAWRPVLNVCDTLGADSDAYWQCYVRYMSTTLYHPACTTKMGPGSDDAAVVNSTLNVRGVRGLRVVDAGIMPFVVSGNTNAPTIMIGERAADFVKNSYGMK